VRRVAGCLWRAFCAFAARAGSIYMERRAIHYIDRNREMRPEHCAIEVDKNSISIYWYIAIASTWPDGEAAHKSTGKRPLINVLTLASTSLAGRPGPERLYG